MIEISIICLFIIACLCRFDGIQNKIWPDYFLKIITAMITPNLFIVLVESF